MRLTGACRHAPINVSDIITGLIKANFACRIYKGVRKSKRSIVALCYLRDEERRGVGSNAAIADN